MEVAPDSQTVPETGLATSSTRTRTAFRTFVCEVVSGPSEGKKVLLGARPILVGSDPACEVTLEDPKVSRKHVELHARPDGLRVRDLGSKNGTFVHAMRITEAFVQVGAAIRIGGTTIRISGAPHPTVPPSGRARFGGLVGDSVPMRELFAVLELASPTDATVLIQGESGTGKEVAARAIHDHSRRGGKPFVIVDCSAAVEQLIESQLFGHVKGAYTGAASDRRGAFAEANGGTLFLDEIGELPPTSQARLLRALEARTIQPLGSDHATSVDVRIIAATHRDLYAMVQDQTFRFDLFHRLAVVHVMVPPLRDRLEDLAPLVRFFYEGRGADPGAIEGDNLEMLRRHAWPGNIRELRNVLDRAWVLSGGDSPRFRDLRIWLEPRGADLLPFEVIDTALPFKDAKERWVQAFERRYLARVYALHGENVSRAAEHAGLSRTHFRELIETHGIKRK